MMITITNIWRRAMRHTFGVVVLTMCMSLLHDRAEASDEGVMFFALGVSTHLPSTDYVNRGLGGDFTMGGRVGRHVFGLDVDIEAMGHCRKDIYTHKGDIYAGERITTNGATLFYGKQARKVGIFELTPYVGLGARCYFGGVRDEKYIDDDDEDTAVYKTGASLGLGLMADIPIYANKWDSQHALCIKPYFCITEYGKQLKLVPSFNLTIQWNFMFD